MASNASIRLLRTFQASRASPRFASTSRPACRFYSSAADNATPPPLLQKLKGELKAAMRAKDTPRLNVLRAILSANLNASKTASPIQTDVQLVALIRKLQKSAHDTVAEAKAANREDLVAREEEQIRILDEYVANSGVQAMGEAELKALVEEAVEASKSAGNAAKSMMGDVMKRLGGALEGKDVDRKELAKLVKEVIG